MPYETVKTDQGSTANEGAKAKETVSEYEQGSSVLVKESELNQSVASGKSSLDPK